MSHNAPSTPRRVFVYGSLSRGQVNHRLLARGRYLGMEKTASGYTMLDLGPYPGVVAAGRGRVLGEVYAIDAAAFAQLDRLEGYPVEYDRCLIPTSWGASWIYLYRHATGTEAEIASGDWLRRSR